MYDGGDEFNHDCSHDQWYYNYEIILDKTVWTWGNMNSAFVIFEDLYFVKRIFCSEALWEVLSSLS